MWYDKVGRWFFSVLLDAFPPQTIFLTSSAGFLMPQFFLSYFPRLPIKLWLGLTIRVPSSQQSRSFVLNFLRKEKRLWNLPCSSLGAWTSGFFCSSGPLEQNQAFASFSFHPASLLVQLSFPFLLLFPSLPVYFSVIAVSVKNFTGIHCKRS